MIIVADRRRDQGFFAHQLERVGNVARRAPEFFLHPVDLKTDVQDVDLLGEDMFGEPSREIHDSVVGKRSGYNDVHK